MIRGAIFDMDGVMVNTEVLSTEGWVYAGKVLHMDITEEFTATYRGTNSNYSRRLYKEKFGEDVDYDKIRDLRTEYMFRTMDEKGVPVKDGLIDLLKFLKSAGIPAAVATSSKRDYGEYILFGADIDDYFSYHMYGDMVTESKPNPEIFLKAAAGLGVPIGECIIFEDSPHGITAGRRAGAVVCAVPDITVLSDEIRAKADHVIPNLRDAIPLIEAENRENR